MKKAIFLLLLPFSLLLCSISQAQTEKEILPESYKKHFDKYSVKGSFIVHDMNNDKSFVYDEDRVKKRFTPASTFKIPNSIIAIEENILKGAESIIEWDSVEYRNPQWNKDLTLKEAFRVSCLPCYITIADQVGEETYKKYLKLFEYGNQSTIVEMDNSLIKKAFWVHGEIRISQEEQINFLRKLYDYKLPASKYAIDVTKGILVDEKTNQYTLRGKTGRGTDLLTKKEIGWYIGYLEKDGNIYFFATNIESLTPLDNFNDSRKAITKQLLKELKII